MTSARYSVALYNFTQSDIRTRGNGKLTTELVDEVVKDIKAAGKNGLAGEAALAADNFLTGIERGDIKLESAADLKKFEKIGAEQAQVWKQEHADRGTIGQLWDRFVADEDGDGKKNAKDDKPLGRW